MNKRIWLLSLVLLLFSPLSIAAGKALILTIDGAIGPATQDYIERGLDYAAHQHADLVIIELNTPGGLETAMRGINQAIIASPIPVATFVTPAGARAASAGTFILYASHIAAMAPGTNLGAASPINITDSKQSTKTPSTEEMKAMNDAAAYIRSLAQLRNRNIAWAESAVRQAKSLSADEAKKQNVIDLIAVNDTQLLEKIDSRNVSVQNKPFIIHSKNLSTEKLTTDWRYGFLSFLSNPNVAYLLLLLALYGIMFELYNPGAILPGVAGVIALLLVLYSFQLLPLNYTGLSLLLIGIAFMISEMYVTSFALGAGGMIAFAIGSIMLFDSRDPYLHISWTLIGTVSIFTMTFFLLLGSLAFRSQQKAVTTGKEGLINMEGVVLSVSDEKMVVQTQGELWEARSSHPLRIDQRVKITQVNGLLLDVEPLNREEK